MNNTLEKNTLKMAIVAILLSWSLTFVVLYWVSKEHPVHSLPSGDIKASTEIKQ